MKRLRPAALLIACALIGAAPASALASPHHATKSSTTYYLALGDSLAAGDQPNAAGATLPTHQGYANDLYAQQRAKHKSLVLKDLGCGGESTSTMLLGGKHCHYAGTQLADAVKFIKTHTVVLITLDIGANDVDGCATQSGAALVTCVESGLKRIQLNVPKIVKRLRQAAGPKVKVAGMTYYDPFLAYDVVGTAAQQPLAPESIALSKQLNKDLTGDFKAQKLLVADVATAFDTYVPLTTTAPLAGHGTVPLAAAKICQLTWMCAAAPRGPNIHANTKGYRTIAGAFAAKLY